MTKGEVDRLGLRIGETKGEISPEDLASLQEYRQTFQEPIAEVFNFILRESRKLDSRCVVTYRIKRLDTIIEKLQRFVGNESGHMHLTRMWDIAGCRCIFDNNDISIIYQMLDKITEKYGDKCKINDYIAEPKQSGYRSIHIYVKDEKSGKPVEIQLRNRTHHNWSTLVEIVDVLFGSSVKEHGAKGQLGEFLALYSHAGTLSDKDFSKMMRLEVRNGIFENMSNTLTRNYLNMRLQWMRQKKINNYFVIEANKKRSSIESYPSFEEAEKVYYKKYVTYKDSNIMLTHIENPSFEQISMAYSNYVLAMHAFFDDYRKYVAERIISSIRSNHFFTVCNDFEIYCRNLKFHFSNLKLEFFKIKKLSKTGVINQEQSSQWLSEIDIRMSAWGREMREFLLKLDYAAEGKLLFKWIIKRKMHSVNEIVGNHA